MSSLSTLAAVKAFLGITSNGQDTLIPQLITRESALVEQWTGRVFSRVTNSSKRLNGNGSQRMTLPDTPILSVSALSLGATPVAESADGIAAGFTFDDTTLYLIGSSFPNGNQNVTCSWTAGYKTTETAYVPAGNVPTLTPTTGGTALEVVAVTNLTSGSAMTQVGSAPASGQFSFSAGVFTFNSAQYNDSVEMEYYYIPAAVEQAVIEMVGLDLQQRTNLGINSKSLAAETVTYEKKGISDSAVELLRPYRKIGVY